MSAEKTVYIAVFSALFFVFTSCKSTRVSLPKNPAYYLQGTLDTSACSIVDVSVAEVFDTFKMEASVAKPEMCRFDCSAEIGDKAKAFRVVLFQNTRCDSINDDALLHQKTLYIVGKHDFNLNENRFLMIGVKDTARFHYAGYALTSNGIQPENSSVIISRVSDILTDKKTGLRYFEVEGEVTCRLYPYSLEKKFYELSDAKFKIAVK